MIMNRVGIILTALMFAMPAWSAGQRDLEKATKLEIVSRQQLADFQKFQAAFGDSAQKREPKALISSVAGIDRALLEEPSEVSLWHSQSQLATGGAGIFNIVPTDGTILKSFPPPPNYPNDMAYDGEFPWCVDFIDSSIHKIDPNTGQILESVPAPSGISSGLTWDSENFWVSEWLSETIYKISRHGVVLDSFPAPGEDSPYGLAWDGQYLWHCTFDTIYKINPVNGAVVDTLPSPSGGAYGLTWDGEYLWVASWINAWIKQVDPVTGAVIHQIPAPDDSGTGLAWGAKTAAYSYFAELTVGGGWTTIFALSNTGSILTTGTLSLIDQLGNPLVVSNPSLGEGSSFPISIPPGGTMFLTVDLPNPDDPGQSGWAMVEFEGTLSGVATYQFTNEEETVTALAGVLPSQPTQFATIPVNDDVSQTPRTAYAIANPTDQPILIKICYVDTDGNVVDDTITVPLDPGEQIAKYFFEDLGLTEFSGSMVLRVQGDGKFVAVALIQVQDLFTITPVEAGKAPNIPD